MSILNIVTTKKEEKRLREEGGFAFSCDQI